MCRNRSKWGCWRAEGSRGVVSEEEQRAYRKWRGAFALVVAAACVAGGVLLFVVMALSDSACEAESALLGNCKSSDGSGLAVAGLAMFLAGLVIGAFGLWDIGRSKP